MRGALAVTLLPVAAGLVTTAGAQQPEVITVAATLDDRLDRSTRLAVQTIIDSAARSHLPVAPLVDKALEGSAKRASGSRIIGAVRMLAADLRVARGALGADADDGELTAAVGALRTGIRPPQLHELGVARREAGLAWPLAVLTDLVTRGVPADTAVSVISGLARGGASDAGLSRFAAEVLRDIAAGVPPGLAAVARGNVDLRPAGVGRGARIPAAVPHGPVTPRTPARPIPPRERPER